MKHKRQTLPEIVERPDALFEPVYFRCNLCATIQRCKLPIYILCINYDGKISLDVVEVALEIIRFYDIVYFLYESLRLYCKSFIKEDIYVLFSYYAEVCDLIILLLLMC